MVEEAADDQLVFEVVRIELAQLREDIGEFLVGFREWFHHGGDGMELTCSVAPHLAALSRSGFPAGAAGAKNDHRSFGISAFCSAFAIDNESHGIEFCFGRSQILPPWNRVNREA
jgi:hypothetical protein